MLGKELNGAAVGDRIGLGKISNGLDQQALAVNVARIRSALASLSSYLGRNRDRENLGHENGVPVRWNLRLILQLKPRSRSITPRYAFFSFYLLQLSSL